MNHTKTFTVATATLLLLTIQSVHAETAQETITADTTAEVQPSETTSYEAKLTNSVIPTAEKEVSEERFEVELVVVRYVPEHSLIVSGTRWLVERVDNLLEEVGDNLVDGALFQAQVHHLALY